LQSREQSAQKNTKLWQECWTLRRHLCLLLITLCSEYLEVTKKESLRRSREYLVEKVVLHLHPCYPHLTVGAIMGTLSDESWPSCTFLTFSPFFFSSAFRSQVLSGHGCNIISSEQHSDTASSRFYQRSAFDIKSMHTDKVTLQSGIDEVSSRLNMKAEITWPPLKKKVCIFVSKYEHCFWELLLRHRAGERKWYLPLRVVF